MQDPVMHKHACAQTSRVIVMGSQHSSPLNSHGSTPISNTPGTSLSAECHGPRVFIYNISLGGLGLGSWLTHEHAFGLRLSPRHEWVRQYRLVDMVAYRVLASPCRVVDPLQAELFIVPLLLGTNWSSAAAGARRSREAVAVLWLMEEEATAERWPPAPLLTPPPMALNVELTA